MRRATVPAIALALLLAALPLSGPAVAQDETTLAYDGDRITLENAENQTIRGTTDLEPGTNLTVRVRSSGSNPFQIVPEATVAEDGTFAATADLSFVEAPANASVAVLHDGDVVAEAPARIAHCTADCEGDRPTEIALSRLAIGVERGAVARIPVSLGSGTGAATVSIGDDAVNYRINATVRDGNGDGEVVVLFDTAAAGTDAQTLSVADDADELTVTGPEPDLGDPIDPADYAVRLFDGERAEGDAADRGVVVVEEADGDGTTAGDGEATISYDGDALTLVNDTGQVIEGETDLPAGMNLTVRVQSADASNPFFYSAETTVDEQGRFAAEQDFSDVPVGVNVTVEVRREGTVLAEAPGEVVRSEAGGATPAADDRRTTAPLDDSPPTDDGAFDLGGLGALLAGGLLAVGAVAVLFGAVRR